MISEYKAHLQIVSQQKDMIESKLAQFGVHSQSLEKALEKVYGDKAKIENDLINMRRNFFALDYTLCLLSFASDLAFLNDLSKHLMLAYVIYSLERKLPIEKEVYTFFSKAEKLSHKLNRAISSVESITLRRSDVSSYLIDSNISVPVPLKELDFHSVLEEIKSTKEAIQPYVRIITD
jgi:hypothetical protein